jgi:hypothetical protein
VIVCLGEGIDAGAQVMCPSVVDTVITDGTQAAAEVPKGLAGPAGGTMSIAVAIVNEDGSRSNALPFSVRFAAARLQAWTTVEAVAAEVPNFKRGGTIVDKTIEGWVRSIAQTMNAAMLKRGLSLNPADWAQPDENATPSPSEILELINRYGAAARLAYALGAQFAAGDWGFAKNLDAQFTRELKALAAGDYDKIFRPSAATQETGEKVAVGDVLTDSGDVERAFSKTQVF